VPKGGTAVLQEISVEVNLAEMPVCGNGVREACEQCDDGNTDGGDGCAANCLVESAGNCGNGEVEPGEDCDDGNNVNGDGCSANCLLERSDLTVEWETSDGTDIVACADINVQSVDISIMPTGEATPVAELTGIDCTDASAVFTSLDFGMYDVVIEGLDASSLPVAQAQEFAVDHSSFSGTLISLVLEGNP
jgi:cysteine-rich repeat protein